MIKNDVDDSRRRFLTTATTVLGGVGAACVLTPFLGSWKPSAKAQAAGAPIEVDISQLEPGAQLTVEWRGKPVWIVRRSEKQIAELAALENKLRDPFSKEEQQPSYVDNLWRSVKKEYFIAVGLCTHLGCVPIFRPDTGTITPDWRGGFYCPCHGSLYDLAGRVFKGVPAPSNLLVPPYHYVNDTLVKIGEDQAAVSA